MSNANNDSTEPTNNPTEPQDPSQSQAQPPVIDYEKLSSIIAGKQSVTEDSVLKGYFKQQGLSKEEMEQAITAFKQQKAAAQPNIEQMQQDIQSAQNAMLQSQIENKALLLHSELGIDLQTVSYVLKLADTSTVVENGTINEDKLKEALNKVLEDIPQLKKQVEPTAQGFRQVGATPPSNSSGEANKPTVPVKRWNRFNN
jgi:hypothetical protein